MNLLTLYKDASEKTADTAASFALRSTSPKTIASISEIGGDRNQSFAFANSTFTANSSRPIDNGHPSPLAVSFFQSYISGSQTHQQATSTASQSVARIRQEADALLSLNEEEFIRVAKDFAERARMIERSYLGDKHPHAHMIDDHREDPFLASILAEEMGESVLD